MLRVQRPNQNNKGMRPPKFGKAGHRQSFWGLVQQRGPFNEVPQDIRRLKETQPVYRGGGVVGGGYKHAGHAQWFTEMNTTTRAPVNTRVPRPPKPSAYAEQSVVIPNRPFKKPTVGQVSWEFSNPTNRPTSYNPPKVGSEIPRQNDRRNGQPTQNETTQQVGSQNQPGGIHPAFEMPPLLESDDVDMLDVSNEVEAGRLEPPPEVSGHNVGGAFGKVVSAETKAMTEAPHSVVTRDAVMTRDTGSQTRPKGTNKKTQTNNYIHKYHNGNDAQEEFIPKVDSERVIAELKARNSSELSDVVKSNQESRTIQKERYEQELRNQKAEMMNHQNQEIKGIKGLAEQAMEAHIIEQAKHQQIKDTLAAQEEERRKIEMENILNQAIEAKTVEISQIAYQYHLETLANEQFNHNLQMENMKLEHERQIQNMRMEAQEYKRQRDAEHALTVLKQEQLAAQPQEMKSEESTSPTIKLEKPEYSEIADAIADFEDAYNNFFSREQQIHFNELQEAYRKNPSSKNIKRYKKYAEYLRDLYEH